MRLVLLPLLTLPLLAQASEVPLGFNLPTAAHLEGWDVGLAFTHRFEQPVKGSGKDAYGLDGYAYAGLGLTFGIGAVKGLNAFVGRTADLKTFTVGLQQRLLTTERFRAAARLERFDEVVTHREVAVGEVGLVGGVLSLPLEADLGPVTASLVPAYVSTTATRQVDFTTQPAGHLSNPRKGLFNVGLGLRGDVTEDVGFVAEYVPRPSRLPADYHAGLSLGVVFKTRRHRFTLAGTTATGSTPNQVFAGDHAGGPRASDQWSLAFNVVRLF